MRVNVALVNRMTLCMCAVIAATSPVRTDTRLQFGLRLDARSSLQWSEGRIFLESDQRVMVTTAVRDITDVWPGPLPGIFSVVSNEGLGILSGNQIIPGGYLFHPEAVLRSSRPDTIWAAVHADDVTRIIEWRARAQREVFSSNRRLIDFDVDRAGRLLILTDAGLQFAVDTTSATRIPLPPTWRHEPERVFLNGDSTEIAVYGGGSLSRFSSRRREWTSYAVDPAKHALVRHVQSRRVRIEPRFPTSD